MTARCAHRKNQMKAPNTGEGEAMRDKKERATGVTLCIAEMKMLGKGRA